MSDKAKLYVDVHVLQTVPPSCINRDDTGSPKTAVYGGVTRARVSSQAWKRAVRLMFRDLFAEEQVGLRTKRATELVAAQLKALGQEKDWEKQAVKALEMAGIKVNSGAAVSCPCHFSRHGRTVPSHEGDGTAAPQQKYPPGLSGACRGSVLVSER